MQFWLKLSITLGISLTVLYISACLFLFFRQNRLIFFPVREISRNPTDLDMDYQEVWLPVSSGKTHQESATEKVHGWWIPSPTADEIKSKHYINSKRDWVLLFFHGNGDNISGNLNDSHRFHQMGFSVFMVDYRGYGLSEGDFPTEASVYEDVDNAWNYLVNQRGIAPENIVIYGHSLGGAIAIDLASRQPNAAGVIVEASFTSIRDMADYQYPYFNILPIDWILTHRFDSMTKVKSLKMPVLFTHGTADTVVPTYMSEELFEATPDPKKLFIVPTADHNNIASVSGDKYFETIREFMKLVDDN
jgi:pimeloyl-ACP methyl ester carboxylesterase